MKKIICIYHSRDLDGWMSAAIVKHWFLNDISNVVTWEHEARMEGDNVDFISKTVRGQSSSLHFLGWDYGDDIPDLSEYDKVIMCDISFPAEVMYNAQEAFHISGGVSNFVWIDHHVSAINSVKKYFEERDAMANKGYPEGIRRTDFAACELTWKYFFPDEAMPEIVRLIGRYDCFGHKGTDEEQKVLEFQYGARAVISDYKTAYANLVSLDVRDQSNIEEKGEATYKYLCTEAKQTYAKAFPIEFYWAQDIGRVNGNPKQCNAKFICVNQERFNPINFGIDYHKEGYDGFACFWYKDGKWSFSLYNDNGQVDCSAIAKNYGGGGHKGAAGFVYEGDIKDIIG
ncbi:MAG: hypothetical protein JXR54_09915 [Tannerellaceae bacterium]|nr:hypothetical protein [Tannerellaceae bacterium]